MIIHAECDTESIVSCLRNGLPRPIQAAMYAMYVCCSGQLYESAMDTSQSNQGVLILPAHNNRALIHWGSLCPMLNFRDVFLLYGPFTGYLTCCRQFGPEIPKGCKG